MGTTLQPLDSLTELRRLADAYLAEGAPVHKVVTDRLPSTHRVLAAANHNPEDCEFFTCSLSLWSKALDRWFIGTCLLALPKAKDDRRRAKHTGETATKIIGTTSELFNKLAGGIEISSSASIFFLDNVVDATYELSHKHQVGTPVFTSSREAVAFLHGFACSVDSMLAVDGYLAKS